MDAMKLVAGEQSRVYGGIRRLCRRLSSYLGALEPQFSIYSWEDTNVRGGLFVYDFLC